MGTFLRLLGFLRPYRRGVLASLVLAVGAMVMTVALPYLTGQAVERISSGAAHAAHHRAALRAGDERALRALALAIAGAVLARWVLTYARRMLAGSVSLGIEYDLRERLY
ncbi:MAG: hypothetical protein FWD42_00410, partial [Solirubrobacterales bacterium]|nr:hypothetical protein [Solirubrobacterales bacterium]